MDPLTYDIKIRCLNCHQAYKTIQRPFGKPWHVGEYPDCQVCGMNDYWTLSAWL